MKINNHKRSFKPSLRYIPAHLIREGKFICSESKRMEFLRDFEHSNNNLISQGPYGRPRHDPRLMPGHPEPMPNHRPHPSTMVGPGGQMMGGLPSAMNPRNPIDTNYQNR